MGQLHYKNVFDKILKVNNRKQLYSEPINDIDRIDQSISRHTGPFQSQSVSDRHFEKKSEQRDPGDEVD